VHVINRITTVHRICMKHGFLACSDPVASLYFFYVTCHRISQDPDASLSVPAGSFRIASYAQDFT